MSTFFKFIVLSTILIFGTSCSNPKEKKTVIVPKKITYLFLTQPSCPSCERLEESMNLAKPKALLSKYFDVKKVYLGEKLPDTVIEPNGTPTVYFLGANDEVLVEPMVGEKEESALVQFLEDALYEFNVTYHVDLVKKYNEKNNTTTTL